MEKYGFYIPEVKDTKTLIYSKVIQKSGTTFQNVAFECFIDFIYSNVSSFPVHLNTFFAGRQHKNKDKEKVIKDLSKRNFGRIFKPIDTTKGFYIEFLDVICMYVEDDLHATFFKTFAIKSIEDLEPYCGLGTFEKIKKICSLDQIYSFNTMMDSELKKEINKILSFNDRKDREQEDESADEISDNSNKAEISEQEKLNVEISLLPSQEKIETKDKSNEIGNQNEDKSISNANDDISVVNGKLDVSDQIQEDKEVKKLADRNGGRKEEKADTENIELEDGSLEGVNDTSEEKLDADVSPVENKEISGDQNEDKSTLDVNNDISVVNKKQDDKDSKKLGDTNQLLKTDTDTPSDGDVAVQNKESEKWYSNAWLHIFAHIILWGGWIYFWLTRYF